MNNIYEVFFTLLRSGIWGFTAVLPRKLTEKEWDEVHAISIEQTVAGIIIDAIGRLPEDYKPRAELRLKWIMQLRTIEKQNRHMNAVLNELDEEFKLQKIKYYLLKGQGLAQNYPTPSYRTCGDIDLFFMPNYFEKAINFFTDQGYIIDDDSEESHASINYKGVEIELHKNSAKFFTKSIQSEYNRTTTEIIEKESETYTHINGGEIRVLPPVANALQLLSHMLRHIIFSGLGLRQICDWTLFVKKYHNCLNNKIFISSLKELKLLNIYRAITIIATEILGLSKEYSLCQTTEQDRKNAKKILDIVLKYGNFGHYGEHTILKTKSDYLKAYCWKVKNCIRFSNLAGCEALSYPLWQLHTIKKMF